MSVQIIKQGNKPKWAVLPYEMYLELVEKAEMLQDVMSRSMTVQKQRWRAARMN